MHTSYTIDLEKYTTNLILNEMESNHLVRVLRQIEGTELEVCNGRGLKGLAKITLAHPKKCSIEILNLTFELPTVQPIHLAIAPTKNMDRLEWFVEKATEIGIDQITLLKCKNNERKAVKLERLEKIILSAMKQSKRSYLPLLTDLTTLENFVKIYPNGGLAHCYDEVETKKTNVMNWPNTGPLLIGPEGDFTQDEVEIALKNGYTAINLGKNRLRTETAALFGVVCLITKV